MFENLPLPTQGGAVFTKAVIGALLRALPYVTWDRTSRPWQSSGCVQGWIYYPDRERDAVELRWDSLGLSFSTSSEAHVEDAHERLRAVVGPRVPLRRWAPSERVEDVFGPDVNRLSLLAEPPAPGGQGDPPQPSLSDAPGDRYLEGA